MWYINNLLQRASGGGIGGGDLQFKPRDGACAIEYCLKNIVAMIFNVDIIEDGCVPWLEMPKALEYALE